MLLSLSQQDEADILSFLQEMYKGTTDYANDISQLFNVFVPLIPLLSTYLTVSFILG